MFERDILTLDPGWSRTGETLEEFEDVLEIQRRLEARGLDLASAADGSTSGPANSSLFDPDGNPILIDQHVK